jgi:hypothetical protein
MCVVLALLMLMGILQKPTHRSYYSKNCLLFSLSLLKCYPWKIGAHCPIYSFH